jgi:hypothetical protein
LGDDSVDDDDDDDESDDDDDDEVAVKPADSSGTKFALTIIILLNGVVCVLLFLR